MSKNSKTVEWWGTKSFAYGETIMSILIGGTFSYLIPTIGVPILVILFCISCLLIWKAYSRASILIPSVLIVLGVAGISVEQAYYIEANRPDFATPDTLSPPLLQNMTIRISDLVREDVMVRNKVFDNCHIYGPAIIYPIQCTISYNTFADVGEEGVFIETTNKTISGAIGLDNCTIKNCTFHKISFIGNSAEIEYFKRGLKVGVPK